MTKKLISILLALAAMVCTLPMRGDSPPERSHEIPVKKSYIPVSISSSNYNAIMSSASNKNWNVVWESGIQY